MSASVVIVSKFYVFFFFFVDFPSSFIFCVSCVTRGALGREKAGPA